MLAIALTIAPIFLLILLGYGFRRFGFPGDEFWRPAENLAYYILLPALIIGNLAKADLSILPVGSIAVTNVAIAVIGTLMVLLLKPLLRIDGPGFTSVLQGAIRINAYIAFAVSELLFGGQGIVLCALFVAVMMPTVNVICIGALAAFASTGKPNWAGVPKQIIQNPIIMACVIGWVINGVGIPLPGWVAELLAILSRAALPVALLCVGAGLVIKLGGARLVALAATCVLKLVVMPISAAIIMHYTGITGTAFIVVMLFATCPASPASYVLSRQLGGDSPLMAAILTMETLLAAIAIPAVIAWANTAAP